MISIQCIQGKLIYFDRYTIPFMKNILLALLMTFFMTSLSQTGPYQRLELLIDQRRYYYTTIYVGTPPQKQSVIVDTGSGRFLLQCSQCKFCHTPQQFQVYHEKQSSTYVPFYCNSKQTNCTDNCPQKQEKQFCSQNISFASGPIYQTNSGFEIIRLQEKGIEFQVLMNCANKESNNSLVGNGVMGLGPNILQSIVYYWFFKQNFTTKMEFSICLSAKGGYLQFGHQQNKTYTGFEQIEASFIDFQNAYQTKQFYSMTFNGVDIFNKDIVLKNGLFFDSGAPASAVPNSQYSKIIKQMNKICNPAKGVCSPIIVSQDPRQCYVIGTSFLFKSYEEYIDSIFPNFELSIGNGSLIWKPSEYCSMAEVENYLIACIDIVPIPTYEIYLLGSNWMRNKKIMFDLTKRSIQIILNYDCQQLQKQNIAVVKGYSLFLYFCMLFFVCFLFMRDKIIKKYRRYKYGDIQTNLQESEQNRNISFENQDNMNR